MEICVICDFYGFDFSFRSSNSPQHEHCLPPPTRPRKQGLLEIRTSGLAVHEAAWSVCDDHVAQASECVWHSWGSPHAIDNMCYRLLWFWALILIAW